MENNNHSSEMDTQSLATVHALLSNQRRHYVITAISEQESPIALDEFATAVIETETGVRDISAKMTQEIIPELHHEHLPKLDDAGIIDYNAETNTITSIQTEELAPILEFTEGSE